MPLGLKITVDNVTREETCDKTICLKDNIKSLGETKVAAGLLGVKENDIKKVKVVGNCNGCEFHCFLRSREG